MNKIILTITIGVVIIFLILGHCHAGLIDYRRLQQNAEQQQAEDPDAPQPTIPSWVTTTPMVKSKTEQKYDTNRDGKLQTAETTIFLRDVLDIIDDKGGYPIDSDILKPYDKNKDGIINRFEAKVLSGEVR